jgi:hypothetical protein
MATGAKLERVSNFKEAYNNLKVMNLRHIPEHVVPDRYTDDLRIVDVLYNNTFNLCGFRPTDLQFAIAQFAVAYSKKYKR